MRIRKRKVPLPFSSLSPIPLSDPCFARFMPPVQHDLLANSSPSAAESPPPDQAIDLDATPAAPISPALNLQQAAGDIDREKIIITDEEGRNDFREKGIVGAHVVALSHSQLPTTSSSSSFLDHEKAFPVKKRSSPWGSSEIVEQVDDDDDDNDQKEGSSNNIISSTSTGTTAANSSAGTASLIVLKKRGRGGALMEGSRCSRVNGRGWRCCQPTLVGYSLCEHHLGKGRLRSITTVRAGAASQKNKLEKQQRPASVVAQLETAANGSTQEEEFIITKPVPMIRRRSSSSSSATKLGMVKARSISSLLDETTTDQTTTNETISRSRPSVFIGRRQ